jgi:glucose-6-phosphate isomerase
MLEHLDKAQVNSYICTLRDWIQIMVAESDGYAREEDWEDFEFNTGEISWAADLIVRLLEDEYTEEDIERLEVVVGDVRDQKEREKEDT